MSAKKITYKTKFNDTLKGFSWIIENPIGNVYIFSGMEEYVYRYNDFALYLNKNGFNVYGLDVYGQGENSLVKDLGKVCKNFFLKYIDAMNDFIVEHKKDGLPSIIFGHSMGSFMVQKFIQLYPNTANQTIICGTNGPNGKLAFKAGNVLAKILIHKNNFDKKSKFFSSLALGPYAKAFKDRQTDFDWLSIDRKNIDDYIKDNKCGYGSTGGFYKVFMKGGATLYNKQLKNIKKNLPIFIISGIDDPVGAMSKGPKSLYELYKKIGLQNVSLKIYPNMRHEILNEKENLVVYNDIIKFLK